MNPIDLRGSEMTAMDAFNLGDEYFLSLTEQKAKPSLLTTAAAAWETFNPLSSYVQDQQLREAYGGSEGWTQEEGYNVYDTLEEEYWQNPEHFQNVTSPEEASYVKASINHQYNNAQIIEDSGWVGIAASMAAGTLDPILAPLALIGGAGVGATRGAMRGAAIATGEMGIQEAMLHETQITRTWQQSMVAMGAAPIFGSIFGALGGAMTKAQINRSIKEIQDMLDEVEINGGIHKEMPDQTVGAASRVGTLEEEQPIGRQGPPVSSQMRMLQSQSRNVVNFVNEVSRHDYQIGKNIKRVEVPEAKVRNADGTTSVQPAYTKIEFIEKAVPMEVSLVRELHEIALNTMFHTGTAYQKYIGSATKTMARLRGRAQRGTMNIKQFRKEIGIAMRKGDVHENPHVQKAAQNIRKSLDDTLERQKAVGLLPEDVKPKYALSYLMRVYDTKYIQRNRTQWEDMLVAHYMSKGMDATEAASAMRDVTNHIMIHGVNPNPTGTKPSTGTITKSRTLDIDDAILAPFLLNDIEYVMDAYMRKAMPQLHWMERFETLEVDDLIQKAKDDYALLINKAKDSKEKRYEKTVASLERQLQRDIKDIENARDLYLGRFNIPDSLQHKITNASRFLRGLTTTANLGSMTLSAIADPSMGVFKNGLINTARGFMQFTSSVGKKGKIPREAMSDAGIAAEMTLASRMLSSTELEDLPPVGKAIMKTFGNVSLMGPWNTAQKLTNGFAAQHRIIKTIKGYDKARPMRKSILASNGIGEDTAKRMLVELDAHAEKFRGGWIPNTEKWTDRKLADKFDDVIFGQTESTTVTPGMLDKPTMMHKELGKVFLQFKSFMFASHQQILLPLVQRLPQGDLQALNGILATGSLAMFAEWSRLVSSGRFQDIEKYTPEDWARAAVDRSGWLSLPVEGVNMVDRISHGRIAKGLGLKQSSKYFYKQKADLLLGPMGSTTLGIINAMSNLLSEDGMTASDIHGIRRILPYQNLFYTRWLFNQMEESIARGR